VFRRVRGDAGRAQCPLRGQLTDVAVVDDPEHMAVRSHPRRQADTYPLWLRLFTDRLAESIRG